MIDDKRNNMDDETIKILRQKVYRMIPKVDDLLNHDEIQCLLECYSRKIVKLAISDVINEYRDSIKNKSEQNLKDENNESIEKCIIATSTLVADLYNASNIHSVINATGVVLHTNLGRSPLPYSALDKISNVASTYSNLEYDIDRATRGSRYAHVEDMICELTGAEAAMVVNNNAAAVHLVLNTLCSNNGATKEAIVSRGELVEIGGAFRIPEVMKLAGAKLVEVGTTNKTRAKDYHDAITDATALLMKVHTSNYKIMGFTESASISELVKVGLDHHIPFYEDMGSGTLINLEQYGFVKVPTVMDSIKAGADIVSFSGDKMLGGPQAGIIVGKQEYINQMKYNHLNRAFRIDKLTLIALEEVLRIYRYSDNVVNDIPTLNMLCASLESTRQKCEVLKYMILKLYHYRKKNSNISLFNLKMMEKEREYLRQLYINMTNITDDMYPIDDDFSYDIQIVKDKSRVGGGAMPMQEIPSYVLSITHNKLSANDLFKQLRMFHVPIIARIQDERLIIDVRTLITDGYSENTLNDFEYIAVNLTSL